jgi:hypothetical protein
MLRFMGDKSGYYSTIFGTLPISVSVDCDESAVCLLRHLSAAGVRLHPIYHLGTCARRFDLFAPVLMLALMLMPRR